MTKIFHRLDYLLGWEDMESLSYSVILEPMEDGGFLAKVPTIPGCLTQGETREEAISMAQDAAQQMVLALQDIGKEIPIEEISLPNSTKIYVVTDKISV